MYEVPSHPDNIVIEVCQDLSASKDDFIVNEIHTMLQAVFRMKYQGIPVKPSSIEVDTSNIWQKRIRAWRLGYITQWIAA